MAPSATRQEHPQAALRLGDTVLHWQQTALRLFWCALLRQPVDLFGLGVVAGDGHCSGVVARVLCARSYIRVGGCKLLGLISNCQMHIARCNVSASQLPTLTSPVYMSDNKHMYIKSILFII